MHRSGALPLKREVALRSWESRGTRAVLGRVGPAGKRQGGRGRARRGGQDGSLSAGSGGGRCGAAAGLG